MNAPNASPDDHSAPSSRIVVLAGGVGGSRFVRGVAAAWPAAQIDVIVNTADDITLHGLRICPDLDTMTYALGGAIDPGRGWGLADEGWRIMAELAAHAAEPTWFSLGDRDIATHLIRTQMLNAGFGLAAVSQALSKRWLPADTRIILHPMSEDRVETHVVIEDPDADGGRRAVHFQEFWVRLKARPLVRSVVLVGVESARPTAGLAGIIAAADLILFAPSNPVVSIGPILAVPGLRESLVRAAAPTVGFAGILGGAPVLGMADKLLPAIGVAVDAAAVGLHYGSRHKGPRNKDPRHEGSQDTGSGLLDAWLMHSSDADSVSRVREAGLACEATGLLMTEPAATAKFIRRGAELVAFSEAGHDR